MESSDEEAQHSKETTTDSSDNQTCSQNEKIEETSLVQQSRRPNLSSLQIPERVLESTFSSNITSTQSPTSTKAGLPPRPSSAKFKSSMRNLLPQKSFKVKNSYQDGEKTVLIIPDTMPSESSLEKKPSTSRSFSLNKVFFSSSTKSTHSLPVTPIANSGQEIALERNLDRLSNSSDLQVQKHITRSFSVPVDVKVGSLRRTDSVGAMIRVIPASPRLVVDGASLNDDPVAEIGSHNGTYI